MKKSEVIQCLEAIKVLRREARKASTEWEATTKFNTIARLKKSLKEVRDNQK